MNERILYFLADNNASFKPYLTTTTEIADAVESTQQTISRRLILLEEEGWISRESTPKGLAILLTKKATVQLRNDYELLSSVFAVQVELSGKLESGIGEGRYYMKQQPYQVQFREKLGFFPWAGTLNLRVDVEALRRFLITETGISIEGFKTKARSFGGLWAYRVTVFGEKAAIIIPTRTTHPEGVVEVISPYYLRERHKLKDGDEVLVKK